MRKDTNKEPKVDWEVEYMKLAKEFTQYIVNVNRAMPEINAIMRRHLDESNERARKQNEDEIRFLFQRYNIEYNEENLKRYRQASYDYWGECLDGRDTSDGYYIPARPTRTHIHLNAINWSALAKESGYEERLERDLANPNFRCPGDFSEPKRPIHGHDEVNREETIINLREYVSFLANVHVFQGCLESIEEDPMKTLEKMGLSGGIGFFISLDVQNWMSWKDRQ